ncbi:MAG: BMP family ABC transporter substrate-binding protein [Defluviitaleaceae bacterium]|nr:BMP family ABC transporter substrate-binding protein [Defluviitaleaceae bacterium]MCL2836956.1 BMP family ABC transporter substrate-binding protein [Defluviitaleaceae bacterium]
MKKAITLLLALAMIFALAACDANAPGSAAEVTRENLKVGMVHISELGDQGFTFNHDQGARKMIADLGLSMDQYIPKFNVSPADITATKAAIVELIDAGCQIIFATSFGYNVAMTESAREFPNIIFCHATGFDAHSAGLSNLHNYFAKIHQARYLAGIAAGLKTENNRLGYVAAHPFSEVISGYTAFYLGALSVNPDVTMDVIYINSWGDARLEREAAEALIARGVDVLSQHSDGIAPALAAQDAGIWHVGYNNDMSTVAPDASLLSPRIDWGVYMTFAVQSLLDGNPLPVDWGTGIETGAAFLSPLNTAVAAPGTQEAIDKAFQEILDGKMIFSGALVDNDGNPAQITNFAGDVIFTFTDENSYFVESDVYSAPSFNAILKGINIIS